MRTLLVGINSKYIHVNLAIRCLKSRAESCLPVSVELAEFTINQPVDQILGEIYLRQPELLGFSCYIWNYSLVRRLVPELKALLPGCLIVLGGPEAGGDPEGTLAETQCDLVIPGEGEEPFLALLTCLRAGEPVPTPGVFRRGAGPLALEALPFPYPEHFEGLAHRILYYEASRGCPFSCQYCLSGDSRPVRFRPLSQVFGDLDRFLQARVPQVKFVDRTFNCRREYALAIWDYLCAHDNGCTNFHFEVAAELFDEETLALLQRARPGLFQLEIGVQSTNPPTLSAVRRQTLPEKLTPAVRALKVGENIHLHLDLIAGLPYEGYERFGESFDYVHSLAPEKIQLGFLKLLKGSGLYRDREKYGLRHTGYPPYEIIRTPWLSYGELLRLKMVEEVTELYYNSGRFFAETGWLMGRYERPFRFYEALGDFYRERGHHLASHDGMQLSGILREFLHARFLAEAEEEEHFQWLAKFDLYRHEKARRIPDWMTVGAKEKYRDQILDWFSRRENAEGLLKEYGTRDPRQLIRSAHIEVFPFDPRTGTPGTVPLLFHYRRRDLLGRAAVFEIRLD